VSLKLKGFVQWCLTQPNCASDELNNKFKVYTMTSKKTDADEVVTESKKAKSTKTAKKSTTTLKTLKTGNATMSDTATFEPSTARGNHLIRGKFAQYTPTKNEDYMSAAQLEHFKIILNDWKQELMNEVDRTVGHMKDESANLPDPVDRATQEEEFSLELRTRDRERKLIKKIDKTLESIEIDEYGFCEDCGVEIGLRRLEARPTATLCIDCKTLAEIKEKQFRN